MLEGLFMMNILIFSMLQIAYCKAWNEEIKMKEMDQFNDVLVKNTENIDDNEFLTSAYEGEKRKNDLSMDDIMVFYLV